MIFIVINETPQDIKIVQGNDRTGERYVGGYQSSRNRTSTSRSRENSRERFRGKSCDRSEDRSTGRSRIRKDDLLEVPDHEWTGTARGVGETGKLGNALRREQSRRRSRGHSRGKSRDRSRGKSRGRSRGKSRGSRSCSRGKTQDRAKRIPTDRPRNYEEQPFVVTAAEGHDDEVTGESGDAIRRERSRRRCRGHSRGKSRDRSRGRSRRRSRGTSRERSRGRSRRKSRGKSSVGSRYGEDPVAVPERETREASEGGDPVVTKGTEDQGNGFTRRRPRDESRD